MRTKLQLYLIFWSIESNFRMEEAMYVIINRHKIKNFDEEEYKYIHKLYSESKKMTNSIEEGCQEFLKQYYNALT